MPSNRNSDDYFSSSTIDSPPREPRKGSKQSKIAAVEDNEQETEEFLQENGPVKVKYSLALTLKSDSGDTIIKFGPYEAFPEQLEDHINKQFNSKYFKNRIKSAAALAEDDAKEEGQKAA